MDNPTLTDPTAKLRNITVSDPVQAFKCPICECVDDNGQIRANEGQYIIIGESICLDCRGKLRELIQK